MILQKSYEEYYLKDNELSLDSLTEESLTNSKGLYNYALEIKDRFLKDLDWNKTKILETGAGRGGVSFHLAKRGAKVTLLDFSIHALEQAKKIYHAHHLDVEVIHGDASHPDLSLSDQYDLIIDSHLLHCLSQKPERISYYSFVRDHLSEQGVFLAETMVHRKNMYFPEGFRFDRDEYVLWQNLGEWLPVRKIMDSLDLEVELKKAGFHIHYFYYYGKLGFIPHKHFLDLPTDILPAAVRLAVSGKSSL